MYFCRMTITQLKALFHSELDGIYPLNEIDSFYHILTDFKLGLSRVDKALNPEYIISDSSITFLKNAINDLRKEKPIQHITKKTEFYGLNFIINENVLIPRPETEELVSWILEDSKDKKNLKILDIGTGSGCISISLAKHLPTAKITAIDFSELALDTAKKNAKLNNISIDFIQQDILETEFLHTEFDIIVSNPPYIRNLEKKEIQKNVLSYEPHSALFVNDNNPLIFYKKIAELASKHLKPNGVLFYEINQYLGNETLNLLTNIGFKNNELKKDIFGNDRMTRSLLV